MKKFLDENFLLNNEVSVKLYHDYAKKMPIYDYHCHLNPKEIYENRPYENITQMWLGGDHYKWRLMRQNGVDEKYITGDSTDYEKFEKFVECVQYAAGNPIYHWCHLELRRYFDCYDILCSQNTKLIWDKCEKFKYTPQQLMSMSDVKVACTTDDPLDTLEYHVKLKDFTTKILPTFRPDKLVNIDKAGFSEYLKKCGGLKTITEIEAFLEDRVKFFWENGCRISDHGLDYVPYVVGDAQAALTKALKGESLTSLEADAYKTHILLTCARLYKKYGIVMQIHYGALRNNNSVMFKKLGPDTGFDSIGDYPAAYNLSRLIDTMGDNPKIILYSLNPNDNWALATMTGNFRNVMFGSAWWFNDHIDGMTDQMKALANLAPLNKFVGMLTDSRSFLSYPRHEYFRRILCSILGDWTSNGMFPENYDILGKIVMDICYNNAVEFFGIEV
ncbi:MAG: Uronate isomerase [Firmicutes bacterium ADurb.Bin193]|nr:MAG: Uronate isomerase [Firmicutes bacterium ADurb.Bin193]